MDFQDSVKTLKGIGDKKADLLEKLDIKTLADFLDFYPRSYQDRRNIKRICDLISGETVLVKARVLRVQKDGYRRGRKSLLKVLADDGTGRIEITFFNASYLANAFKEGEEYSFYGKAVCEYGKNKMVHPDFSAAGSESKQGIVPVYPLTSGISQNEMRKWQYEVSALAENAEEYLPKYIIERNNLCSYAYALTNIHFPQEPIKLKQARYRLVFDEILTLQTGLFAMKSGKSDDKKGIAFDKSVDAKIYEESLPYPLTNAQKRTINEIFSDMESDKQMSRLVQGDVGSGKTAVAEMAMFKAVKCGFQAVLMAPTEILAKQHFEGIRARFEPFGINTAFLSGSTAKKEREDILLSLAKGEISVLIGTHALIQPDVEFKNLGLVITDEQHRFGVNQRSLLGKKGINPDVLVMTATPIPRTLAVILYGDLDISIIDELPPGRQKIVTKAVTESGRDEAYAFLRSKLDEGRQAYVVAPLIEDSDVISVRSAESIYEELSKKFKGYNIELLHGEMKQKEKDDIMMRFASGIVDVLVSTVVIEVGINVPNSTVMVIENAERFGLAQMHQLRGRVGRGKHQSYCILVTEGKSDVAKERAEIMVSTSDGFVIAEKDLELRGPGEFFGTRQHGLPDLKIANLIKHIDMLELVKNEARIILEKDPQLKKEEHKILKQKILKTFKGSLKLEM